LDADTGKANVSFGGKMTPDDFYKLRPEAVAKIEKIVNEKSRRQQALRDQFIDSLSPEERQNAWLLLQGSEAKIGLSGKDIENLIQMNGLTLTIWRISLVVMKILGYGFLRKWKTLRIWLVGLNPEETIITE
jgi:hypothetical protein